MLLEVVDGNGLVEKKCRIIVLVLLCSLALATVSFILVVIVLSTALLINILLSNFLKLYFYLSVRFHLEESLVVHLCVLLDLLGSQVCGLN